MKREWPLVAASIALVIGASSIRSDAQSAEERKALSESVNAETLLRLSVEFNAEFERQEKRVLNYLSNHPDKPRSFEKNGSTYYLKLIDPDGNPVYIGTRRRSSVNPVDGGGSR